MFILTDGKNYIIENPLKKGEYMCSTSSIQAKEFSYKQARTILQSKSKSMSWVKSYYMVDLNTGEIDRKAKHQRSNEGVFIGSKDIEFDEDILNKIIDERNNILSLAGWNITQLETYKNMLDIALSKYDSAESDILHVIQEYSYKKNKKPQAHKMAQVGYLLEEIRSKHAAVKQCQNYIRVMMDAITKGYNIEKLKLELSKADHKKYKGRTEYYQQAIKLLG